jgi:EAL and modified HD-GYP domain-containing signal transduction protein
MYTEPIENEAVAPKPVSYSKDFYLARQPIVDRNEQLIAHELLFRNANVGTAGVNEDLYATASVIANLAELGLERVAGNLMAFINIDESALSSGILHVLPQDKVVLEILETVQATPQLLARVNEMKVKGFTFALDDVVDRNEQVRRLLPLVDVVKIDILGMQRPALSALARSLRAPGRKLLAEKVETAKEFEYCKTLGFDYFQGYFFAKPVVLSGRKLSPSESALMDILNLIERDADMSLIGQAIKHDAAIGINLLRLVNTAAFGARGRIDSVIQALQVLGTQQLKRWLHILQFAKAGSGGALGSPLLSLAITRGRLIELIAEKQYPGKAALAQTGFTVGMMSLIDTLLSMPMANVLEMINVVDDVREALLHRRGPYGDMLRVVERLEHDAPLPGAELAQFGLNGQELSRLQLNAFEWANAIGQMS